MTVALRVPMREGEGFLSLRTTRLVREAIARAIKAGHALDDADQRYREIDAQINACRQPVTGQWHRSDQHFYDLCGEEQRITGEIDRLRRALGEVLSS